MIRLTGHVTALSPIAVTYADLGGALPRTPHGEVLLFGGTFRGPLRKAAFRALRRRLARHSGIEERQVFTLEQAYMLSEGVDATGGLGQDAKGYSDPPAEAELRRLNPMLNLFGRWQMPSRLCVDGLRAPESAIMTTGIGARTDTFARDGDEIAYLSDEDVDRLMAMFASKRNTQAEIDEKQRAVKRMKREIVSLSGDERSALSDEIRKAEGEIKAIKDSREGAKESIQRTIDGFESIAPGTALSHRMTLTDERPQALGLLLIALAELARQPFIGGHRQIGCGEIAADWEVRGWPAGKLEPETIGTVGFDGDGFRIEGEALTHAVEAFDASLGETDLGVFSVDEARRRLNAGAK